MPYLLDSDVLRYYLDDLPTAVDLMAELVPHGVAITIISYLELYQGTLQTPDPEQAQRRLETSSLPFRCFPFRCLLPDAVLTCANS